MAEGVVKWYNDKKGYGFIDTGKADDLFFHKSKITDHGYFGLQKDDRVSFEVKETGQGLQAVNVKVLS